MKLAHAYNRSVGTSPFKHWKMNVHRWCCLLLCRLFQSLVGKPGPCMIFSLRTTLTPLFRSLSRFSARVDPTILKHSRKLVWLANKSTSILPVFPPNPFFVVPCCIFSLLFQSLNVLCIIYTVHSVPSILAPVVQKVDSAIQWIVIYPADSAIQLLNNWGQDKKSWDTVMKFS